MNLSELNASLKGQGKADRRRIGRGNGSGWGKTAGRGHKGAQSRAGWSQKVHFEGGQMPLMRRIPKRGFTNALFMKDLAIVNLSDLEKFAEGTVVTPDLLLEKRMILKLGDGLKVLGQGALTRKLEVQAHAFSASARQAIEAAGGAVKELTTKRAAALSAIKGKRFKGKRRKRQIKAGKPVTRAKR